MNKTLVVATRNKDKLKEIKDILTDLQLKILSLDDFPNIPVIIEDGKTLEENATKKATTATQKTKLLSIGEDTGLEIDYLDGKPGVYSSRFAGPGCSYYDNNKKVLESLKNVPHELRKAKFRCIIAIAMSYNGTDNGTKIVEGRIDGYIGTEQRGNYGFGYDPIFIIPEYNKTFAELGPEIKNKISHRAEAVRKCRKILVEILTK